MTIINQRNVKFIVGVFSLFNAIYFIYGLVSTGFTAAALFDFFLFQWVLIVFYMLYVSSVKWFNERVDELKSDLVKQTASYQDLDVKISRLQSDVSATRKNVGQVSHMVAAQQREFDMNFKELSQDKVSIRREIEIIRALIKQYSIGVNKLETTISEKLATTKDSLLDHQKASVKTYIEHLSSSEKEINSQLLKNADSNATLIEKNYWRIDALFSIYSILKPQMPIPMMKHWAVSSDYAHYLITEFFMNQQKTIVDVGSGISTLVFAYLARIKEEGKVISLEHNEEFVKKTNDMLRFHGLENYATVLHCPLVNHKIEGKDWLWYDVSSINLDEITLLSVDGPPGSIQENSRFPAVPVLFEKLDDKGVIYLDDGARKDEKLIAEQWTESYNLNIEFFESHKGIFRLTKK